MAEIATPNPARPRTRDDNDPAVNPDDYLRQKREYNARHKAERAAYDRRRYAAKKAAKEALEMTPVVSVM